MPVKFTRLFQPRNPKFWLVIVLNALSASLAWVAQGRELSWPAATLVTVFATGNAALGAALVIGLMKTPPSNKR
jgi:hypothetical protein